MRGAKRVRQAGRWLRSRRGQQLMILGYHRVAGAAEDAYGITVRPAHFAAQMAVLRRAAQPLGLVEALAALQAGTLPPRAVAVTFDDGYADFCSEAYPMLAAQAIPATVFVVAGSLGQELWWDALARLILQPQALPAQLHLDLGSQALTWSRGGGAAGSQPEAAARRELLAQLYTLLAAKPALRQWVLAELEAWSAGAAGDGALRNSTTANNAAGDNATGDNAAGDNARGAAPQAAGATPARVMAPAELVALAQDSRVDIGSHTMTHPTLATLSPAEQARELEQSKRVLEQVTGRPVAAFSYPHGSATPSLSELVRAAGYTLACASHNDLAGARSDAYLLPRFWPGDVDGPTFARWLQRWLGGWFGGWTHG